MKCKWVILAAVLLMLLVASPAMALTQDEAQQMVKSVGCTADVFERYALSFNAYYDSSEHVIVLMGLQHLPESWQRFILWHETGHCLQMQSGRLSSLRYKGRYEVEWDADAFAIRQLAEEGVDGADLNHDIWGQLYRQYKYEGHEYDSHGTSVARITRGHLNRWVVKHQGA